MPDGPIRVHDFRDHPMQRIAFMLSARMHGVVSNDGERTGYDELIESDNHGTLHVVVKEPSRTRQILWIFCVVMSRPKHRWVLDITPDGVDPRVYHINVYGKGAYEQLAHEIAAELIAALEQECVPPPYSITVKQAQDAPRRPHFGF